MKKKKGFKYAFEVLARFEDAVLKLVETFERSIQKAREERGLFEVLDEGRGDRPPKEDWSVDNDALFLGK